MSQELDRSSTSSSLHITSEIDNQLVWSIPVRTTLNTQISRQHAFSNILLDSNNISVNINYDLQSWLNDDDIITEVTFPNNFRCLISGPSESGKTFLLKKLILASIYFDKLYNIGLLVINTMN